MQSHKTVKKKTVKTYGWRKCSKSQARRMETDRSGSPLWGRQALCWIIPSCWSARCCRSWWSMNRRRDPTVFVSSSPRLLLVDRIWAVIASRRHRNCFEIVWRARDVYVRAEPGPATASKDEATTCIWWWYWRYRCSTWHDTIDCINHLVLSKRGIIVSLNNQ